MFLRRLALALAAGALSLLVACAAPSSPTPASTASASAAATSSGTSAATGEPKVTMSDCEEPPLGSRVSRKCPHGKTKASQAPAEAGDTTTK